MRLTEVAYYPIVNTINRIARRDLLAAFDTYRGSYGTLIDVQYHPEYNIWQNYSEYIFSAIENTHKHLPIDGKKINIGISHKVSGIRGCMDNKRVVIQLNTLAKDIDELCEDFLEGTVAHEFHHVIRDENPGIGETLEEMIVSEGLAKHFELQIGRPIELPSWSCDMSLVVQMKEEAEKLYDQTGLYEQWFSNQSPSDRVLRKAGYVLGYYLIRDYLKKHPNETAASLIHVPAKLFIP